MTGRKLRLTAGEWDGGSRFAPQSAVFFIAHLGLPFLPLTAGKEKL
jgi:hypothetical protein